MNSLVKNDLFDYKNRYIYQYKNAFKFSLDSLLLAEFVNLKKSDKLLLDMCTGNAVIPLVLSLKSNIDIIGFEIQKDIAYLANESVNLNQLNKQVRIINDDIKNIFNYYNKNIFDIVTCNPPYFKNSLENDNIYLKIARHEVCINLEEIFIIVSNCLKDNGVFYLVHLVTRIDEIFIYANRYNLNVKILQLITTNKSNVPKLVLVKCVKNSKLGLKFNKIINIDEFTSYQNLFKGGVK